MHWPPKFTLDGTRILELLTGDRFYSAADAALREAVLNAIDACGRRRALSERFTPQIGVTFDQRTNTVTVADNGDGMNQNDIADLFARVGSSAANIAQQMEAGQYKAIGEFGIGVVSYFLACDKFDLHTQKSGHNPVGVAFHRRMFDIETPAEEIKPHRDSVGTTVTLYIKNQQLFQLLQDKFPHWVRDVEGLTAAKLPENVPVPQGGLVAIDIRDVDVKRPDWVEVARVGPPAKFDVWSQLDGRAHVDVLYRGVFVQRCEVPGLWGIQGSIHVDPKRFKPHLNRESFIGDDFSQEIARFLQTIHPKVLLRALDIMKEEIANHATRDWSIHKWVTLWLAVPRGGEYADVVAQWDNEFWNRKAFWLLEKANKKTEISLAAIQGLRSPAVYLAPQNLAATHFITPAVRVLQAQGKPVIQGITRDTGYLSHTPLARNSATDSLLSQFQQRLPKILPIANIAEQLVSAEAVVTDIFSGQPPVRVVSLGAEAAAIVVARQEIWVNPDCAPGKGIIKELCDRNEGYFGLLAACQKHAPASIADVARALKRIGPETDPLGPVRRQYLRRLAQ